MSPETVAQRPARVEDKPHLSILHAICDPGAFVARRRWLDGDDDWEYETLTNWQARAVLAVLATQGSTHPIELPWEHTTLANDDLRVAIGHERPGPDSTANVAIRLEGDQRGRYMDLGAGRVRIWVYLDAVTAREYSRAVRAAADRLDEETLHNRRIG